MVSRARVLENLKRLSSAGSNPFKVCIPDARKAQYIPVLASLLSSDALCNHSGSHPSEVASASLAQVLGVEETDGLSLLPAVFLVSNIMSIRNVKKGQGVSYGATFVYEQDSRLGLVPVGFADGIDRKLSGQLAGELVYKSWLGREVRVPAKAVGRIAMDSVSIDLHAKNAVKSGCTVEFFREGSDLTIADAAALLGISTSEFALRLSERSEVILCP
jgi:alanine racemase